MGESAAVGMQAIAGAYQANSELEASRFNAGVANKNAELADLQGQDAIRRGTAAENKARRDTAALVGAQRAAAAANGLDVGTGTASALIDDTSRAGELDALTARNNAALDAWGFKVQANDYRAKAIMEKANGVRAAGSTIITSGAKIAGYGAKTEKVGGYSNSTTPSNRLQGPARN